MEIVIARVARVFQTSPASARGLLDQASPGLKTKLRQGRVGKACSRRKGQLMTCAAMPWPIVRTPSGWMRPSIGRYRSMPSERPTTIESATQRLL
eukprot:7829171-Pyramimonas_sp.AAC.1